MDKRGPSQANDLGRRQVARQKTLISVLQHAQVSSPSPEIDSALQRLTWGRSPEPGPKVLGALYQALDNTDPDSIKSAHLKELIKDFAD
jgi:hypothetical protein